MKLPYTGGCACGAIRYECNAEPIMMGKCHCRDCQHISGGPFVPFVIVPTEAFRLMRGDLQYHFTESLKGGKHKRGFCENCGSRLTGAESETPSPIVGIVADGHELFGCSWLRNVSRSDARVQRGSHKANPNLQEHDVCAIRRFC